MDDDNALSLIWSQAGDTVNQPRILIAGVGNIFLGDDAFGVEVVKLLKQRPFPDEVRIVDFGIRGLDLTYALLEGYEAAILVDAVPRGGQPGTLYVLQIEPEQTGPVDLQVQGHNFDPVKVLRLAAAMGSPVRKLFVVGCEPECLDEAEEMSDGLSEPVRAAMDEAINRIESLVGELCHSPSPPTPSRGERGSKS
jgi:hydrogenase maturation protease